MPEIECAALPVALRQHEYYTGLWLNEDKTFMSVTRLGDFPGVVPAEIETLLKKGIHEIESLPEPELIRFKNSGADFIYRVENVIMQASAFEKMLVDAALLADNPKMYLYSENGPLLVEHSDGYYLIASIQLEVKSDSYFSLIDR